MNWEILAAIIAKEGIPIAEAIFKKWSAGTVPTQGDFDELRAMASVKAVDILKSNLVKAGIALDSPEAVALISMAQ